MGKFIHILAIVAIVSMGVSLADATSPMPPDRTDDQYYDYYSDSSSEEDDCQQKKCQKPNEVYDVCPASCPPRVCGVDERLILCAPQPKPGDPNCNKPACRCKNGFYRDNKGNCVRWEQCPKCPNPNEVYDQCFSPCLQRTCDYDPRLVRCAPPPKLGDPGCVAGCRCADGFVRNSKGVCIPPRQCTSCRGDQNAVPGCGVNCGRKCSDIGKTSPSKCPKICDLYGCDCKRGFYYDETTNKCVSKADCFKCSKRNEIYDQCFFPCLQATCTNTPRPELVKCPCVPGCRCRDGYVRNDNGDCILKKDCVKCLKRNEVYDKCYFPCLQATCTYTPRPELVKCPCVPGCRCRDGYVRNNKGDCIRKKDCGGCGGDINAVPGCGVNCGKKCEDYGSQGPFRCPRICNKNGCDCKDGFYYDRALKKCVPPRQCTKTCKANEVFVNCANGGCRRRKCTDIDGPVLCIDPIKCEPGCICADGYYQDADGNCVSKQQCQTQNQGCNGDKNAVPGCGVYCGQKCSDIGKPGSGICPLICYLNACDCKKGYYYDEIKKKCVLPEECTPQCKLNEELSPCANGICKPQDCKDKGTIMICKPMAPGSCRPGCVCKFKHLRKSGVCIPEKECDATPQCKENEELSPCANGVCRAQDCKEKGTIPLCPPMTPDSCRPGCVCKANYLRKSGVCIPETECDANIPDTRTNVSSCDNTDEIQMRLRQGNYKLSGKLLYENVKANPKTSVVGSAFSVTTPLATCLLYAKADAYSELLNALNVNTADEIRCAFRQFLDSVKATEGTELDLAAKFYVKDTYQFSEPFKKDAREIFNAEEESINFENSANAANTINQWVSGATKGKITDLVKPEMFDSLTRFVLANAVYFKGAWKIQFDPNDTKKANFYVDSQTTKQVDMMELKARLNYNTHDDLDAQTVELLFKDENISFVVILPNQNDGILDLVDKLQDGATLERAVSSFGQENVILNIPRMDISTSTDLVQALQPAGVKSLFTPGDRLQGTIVPDESLYISIAVQKATFTLDENGAEAAAANAFIATRSLPKTVIADHPYAYCIKVGKVVLFCGVNYG